MRICVFGVVALLALCPAVIPAQDPQQTQIESLGPPPVVIPPDLVPPEIPAPLPAPISNVVLGTWKLNPEKSRYSSGESPRSNVRQFIALPDGFIVSTISGISAQGIPTFTMSAARYDGRNYPIYNQVTLADFMVKGTKTPNAQAYKVIDEHTVEITNRESGKVTTVLTRTVSRDRKVMTLVTRGTNAQGQAVNNVEIFERQ
jgi:hypothetical protein